MKKSDYQHRLDFWRARGWSEREAEIMAERDKPLTDEAWYLLKQHLSETWEAIKATLPAWIRRRLN